MAEFLGSQIVEQGDDWGFDRQSGFTLIRRWRGNKQWADAYLNTLANDSNVLRARRAQDGDSPVYTVTAEYGQIQTQAETDGTIPYFWELAGNMLDKSSYENPAFDALTTAQKAEVKKAFEENTENPTFGNATQDLLYDVLINGRETYQVSAYALRINRTYSSNYSNTIPTANVGKVYTYAQIQAEAASIASPISVAIDSCIPSGGAWLKQTPVLTELSNRKILQTQEWWWSDGWSTTLYEAAT